MGSFLRSKNGLEHEIFPKTVPRGATPDSASPFWTPFGYYVSYFLYFFAKKERFSLI